MVGEALAFEDIAMSLTGRPRFARGQSGQALVRASLATLVAVRRQVGMPRSGCAVLALSLELCRVSSALRSGATVRIGIDQAEVCSPGGYVSAGGLRRRG